MSITRNEYAQLRRVGITATLLGLVVAVVASIPAWSASGAGSPSAPTSIPVLDWHQLNNGCASTAPVCNGPDQESVSTAQLTAELGYLNAQGYHTVSAAQYLSWAEGANVTLPSKPIFLVADNGIENLLAGAAPVLQADGFTMAVAVVTGFADGASGVCSEPQYQPGCPRANKGWDATWPQLSALPASVYSFIIESGPAGHFVQQYDPKCTAFYACMATGESDANYESRVQQDVQSGQREIMQKLGPRFTTGLWVVPYSDAGYTACTDAGCTAQPYDGPPGWLSSWTASTFPVAFVEDAFRNGLQHERFRIDMQGWMSEATFESTLTADLAAGAFTLTNTPPPPPPPVLPPPPPPTTTNPVAAIPVVSLDSATVSLSQVQAELAYLTTAGYHTISAGTYATWVTGVTVALPAKPILITVTGDNAALLSAISPNLVSAGYSAVDFVSTARANTGGTSATWAQLAALPSAAWQFSMSSGTAGGTLVASDPSSCNIYYACQAPGESSAAYQTRVANEIGIGRLAIDNGLWMQTVSDSLWSPPFGDAGQAGQPYNGPAGWLSQWSSEVFGVVFVPTGAAGNNEHTAMAVTGTTTEATFESTLTADLAAGAFNG